ncbi:MAG: hypothetical protein J6W60_08060 [Treponema sp.]|nr:hypothetical protein [Treponema sp.]MBP5752794.1 hypothetical protein [Treponema sp.]
MKVARHAELASASYGMVIGKKTKFFPNFCIKPWGADTNYILGGENKIIRG